MSQTQQYGSGKLAYSVLGFIKFFFVGSLRAQQCSCNASTYIWVPSFPVSLPGLCFIKTFWHLSYCVVRARRWHNQHRANWHAQVNFTVRATSGWCSSLRSWDACGAPQPGVRFPYRPEKNDRLSFIGFINFLL